MCLICTIFVLLVTATTTTGEAQQFFQGDQTTFSCNHSLSIDKLSQVQWMINGAICANLDITSGGDTALSLNCGLENRAEMNITHLVVSSLETRDDGGYSCKVKDDDPWADFTVTANFNVTINVRPENHTLSVGEVASSTYATCDKEVTVSAVEDSSTLTCSVDSKPQADITWSSVPVLSKSWQNVTMCKQRSDTIYHCTNTLTVPKYDVPPAGSLAVTCQVQVQDAASDRCIKLLPILTTTEEVITTTVGTTSTASMSSAIPSEPPTREQPTTTSEQPITTSEQPTTTSRQQATATEQSTTTSGKPTTASEQTIQTTTNVDIATSTGRTTPTSTPPDSPSSPKWKNIYIVPIVVGTAIIAVVVVGLIVVKSRDQNNTHGSRKETQNGRRVTNRKSHARQMVVPAIYASISDAPPKKPQHTKRNNPNRHHLNIHQEHVSRHGREANRRTDPVIWNNIRQGPVSSNRHGVPRRSDPANWNSNVAYGRPHGGHRTDRAFQQLAYPPIQQHVTRANMPHVAKAYRSGYWDRGYY